MKNSTPYLLNIVDKVPNSNSSWTKSHEESKSIFCVSVDRTLNNSPQPSNYIKLSSSSTILSLTKETQYTKKQNKVENLLDK